MKNSVGPFPSSRECKETANHADYANEGRAPLPFASSAYFALVLFTSSDRPDARNCRHDGLGRSEGKDGQTLPTRLRVMR